MLRFELLPPIVVAEPDRAVIDGIIVNLPDNVSAQQASHSDVMDETLLEMALGIAVNIHAALGRDGEPNIKFTFVEPKKNVIPTGRELTFDARAWHQDGDLEGAHLVLLTTGHTTEILTGSVSLEDVSEDLAQREPGSHFDSGDHLKIEQHLTDPSDDNLASPDMGISKLIPYLGYLLGPHNYHRTPINDTGETITRGELRFHFVDSARAN